MGISRIGNITGLDYIAIPVAIAVRPRSRSVRVSQGKGLTLPHAMVSAILESAEVFHGEDLGSRTSWHDALGFGAECGVEIEQLGRTPLPLTAGTRIPWLAGHDLLTDRTSWVPAEIVQTDYARPRDAGSGYFNSSTNGLASGNDAAEAISAGLCELIERDALAIWEDCRILLNRFAAANVVVGLWDTTSDIGIPVYVCDIRARSGDPSSLNRRFRGCGCHPDPAVALCRALTEAAQIRLTHIAGIRDDLSPEAYEETLEQRTGAALLDALARQAPPVSYPNPDGLISDDVASDVTYALQRLRAVGIHHAIAIDLTRAELGIPVVRMVVPGLEGDPTDPAYRPGPRARRASGLQP
jgi:ribosomal protein S12 methylthiotransferase accessory factor